MQGEIQNHMFAVIRLNGKQYKVRESDRLTVDLTHQGEKDKALEIHEVLLLSHNGNIEVGRPYVNHAVVEAVVLGEIKGEKIDVYKFKSKARYRRHTGFRPVYSQILIKKILGTKNTATSQKN